MSIHVDRRIILDSFKVFLLNVTSLKRAKSDD